MPDQIETMVIRDTNETEGDRQNFSGNSSGVVKIVNTLDEDISVKIEVTTFDDKTFLEAITFDTKDIAAGETSYISVLGAWPYTRALVTAAGVPTIGDVKLVWDFKQAPVDPDMLTSRDKGVAGGVCPLDELKYVPLVNLPPAIVGGMNYKGTWNAATNTPTLSSSGGGGDQGDYYVVGVDGTTVIDGISEWKVGDWIVNNGSIWEKVDNTERQWIAHVKFVDGVLGSDTSGDGMPQAPFQTVTHAQTTFPSATYGTRIYATNISGENIDINRYGLEVIGAEGTVFGTVTLDDPTTTQVVFSNCEVTNLDVSTSSGGSLTDRKVFFNNGILNGYTSNAFGEENIKLIMDGTAVPNTLVNTLMELADRRKAFGWIDSLSKVGDHLMQPMQLTHPARTLHISNDGGSPDETSGSEGSPFQSLQEAYDYAEIMGWPEVDFVFDSSVYMHTHSLIMTVNLTAITIRDQWGAWANSINITIPALVGSEYFEIVMINSFLNTLVTGLNSELQLITIGGEIDDGQITNGGEIYVYTTATALSSYTILLGVVDFVTGTWVEDYWGGDTKQGVSGASYPTLDEHLAPKKFVDETKWIGQNGSFSNDATPDVSGIGLVTLFASLASPLDVTDFDNGVEGQLIIVRYSEGSGADVTIKNGANIVLKNGDDFILNTVGRADHILLTYRAGLVNKWYEIARSDDVTKEYVDGQISALVVMRADVALAGATPVYADISGIWVNGDRGMGVGTGGRIFMMARYSDALTSTELT